MKTTEITIAILRMAAMNLLAMREHSSKELYKKLVLKFEHPEMVNLVINTLTTEGLQSDLRFTEAFIAMRKRQGKGPLVIANELKERGIERELIYDVIQTYNQSWSELALSVRYKKFGREHIGLKDKARQMRFLAARGFSPANIQFALGDLNSDC